jgi:hypothetical protein
MKLIFIFCFLLSFASAQTRPTGGTGPKFDFELISQVLSPLDFLISTRVKENYAKCGITLTRSEHFNIYKVYVTLSTLNLLKSMQEIKFHKYSFEFDCVKGSITLNNQMSCLLEGTDQNLNYFVSHPFSTEYLQTVYNLRPEEAKSVMDFLFKVNLSLKDRKGIK